MINERTDNTNEKEYVDILPLPKGKRLLVYLADFFLNFVLAFLILNIAVAPIGKAITGFNEKSEQYNQNNRDMRDILYGNKVVLKSSSISEEYINDNISYTYDCWLSYYVLDAEESINSAFPQYGHKQENEVIYNFFHTIRGNDTSYKSLFDNYNKTNQYFSFSEGSYVLNENAKTNLSAYFDPKNEMGDTGKTFYNNILNSVFMPLLSEVFADIEKNDLSFEGKQYITARKNVDEVTNYRNTFLIIVVFVAYFLSWLTYYIIIPLCNKNRKTLATMMMRIERINIDRLYILKKIEAVFSGIYALITNLLIILILPVSFISINYVFTFDLILTFAGLSLLFNLVSLGFVMANSFNRSLSDIFSRSVMITTNNLDAIYRAKGYNI